MNVTCQLTHEGRSWSWKLIVRTCKGHRSDHWFTANWTYKTSASAIAAARRWAKILNWQIVELSF